MPIEVNAEVNAEICRFKEDGFASLAYEVMACAFQVHNEMGRFFDEAIYKRIVAQRLGGGVDLEVPVVVRFGDFSKSYYLDMLVGGTAIFEWKAVECLVNEHRAQLINYLLLTDLPRGKLVNMRSERVQHEFVNTSLRPSDRKVFKVNLDNFKPLDPTDQQWQQYLVEAIRDWGTGLDIHLYESAITHALGGNEQITKKIDIFVDGVNCGHQKVRLTKSNSLFRVSAFGENKDAFQRHLQKFIQQTNVPALHWVNITTTEISFTTLLNPTL